MENLSEQPGVEVTDRGESTRVQVTNDEWERFSTLLHRENIPIVNVWTTLELVVIEIET
jgi:hypothetical protein